MIVNENKRRRKRSALWRVQSRGPGCLLQFQADGELRNTAHTQGTTAGRSALQGTALMGNIQVCLSTLQHSMQVTLPAAQRTSNPQNCVTQSRVSVTFPPRAPDLGAEGFLH